MTNKIDVLFDTTGEEKEKDYSVLVDCMYAALNRLDPPECNCGA